MGFVDGAPAPVGTTPDSRPGDGLVRPLTGWWHRLLDRCRDGVAGLSAVHGARRVALVPIGVVVVVAIGWWALRPGPQRPESTMAFAGEYLPAANGVTAGATVGATYRTTPCRLRHRLLFMLLGRCRALEWSSSPMALA